MLKKTPFLRFSLFCSILMLTNSTILNASLSYSEKISIADQLYSFIKKQNTLDQELFLSQEKVRQKNTLSLGSILTTAIVTSMFAGPALTTNYLNTYITPEKYQNTVNTMSMGAASFIGALGALKIARQGIKSVYDSFMYGKEQKVIEKEIEKIQYNRNNIRQSIKNIEQQYPEFFTISALDYDQERTCRDFINFYNENHSILDRSKMDIFFQTHPGYTIESLIAVLSHQKIQMILTAVKPQRQTIFQSNGNIGLGIAANLLLAPWYLIFSAVNGADQNQHNKDVNKRAIEEIDRLTTMINKLHTLASE